MKCQAYSCRDWRLLQRCLQKGGLIVGCAHLQPTKPAHLAGAPPLLAHDRPDQYFGQIEALVVAERIAKLPKLLVGQSEKGHRLFKHIPEPADFDRKAAHQA